MRRRNVFLIALACLALLAAGVVPWTMANDRATEQIGKRVKALTGLDLVIDGRTTIALLPAPRIKLEDVRLTAPGSVIVKAAQFRGELKLWPLLRGEFELADATLLQPEVDIVHDGNAADLWSQAITRATLSANISSNTGRHLISRVIIIGGSATLRNREGRPLGDVRDVNAIIAWDDPSDPLSIAGQGVFRGQVVDLSVDGVQPLTLAAGGTSEFIVKAATPRAQLTARGKLADRGQTFDGRARFATTSLGELIRWLGAGSGFASVIDDFAVDGQLQATPRGVTLAGATVTVGKDTLEGALAARMSQGRVMISGTLAANELDLARFINPIGPVRASDGNWSREDIARRALDATDLDLRVSAVSARLGRLALTDMATSIALRGGRLEVALGRASAYRGTAKGRLLLTPSEAGWDAKLVAAIERAELGLLLADLTGVRRLTGVGSAQVTLDAGGQSLMEFAHSLTGRGSFAMRQGEISGIDLAEIMRRAERRPLSTAFDWRSGRTSFEQAGGSIAIANGVAQTSDLSFAGPLARLSLAGRISIVDQMVDLRGRVSGPQADADGLPIEVQGSLDDPRIGPDVQALIRRSGAAAPLLDTVRGMLAIQPAR